MEFNKPQPRTNHWDGCIIGKVLTPLHVELGAITREDRANMFRARSCTYWFTGLSGSGKSTIAIQLERELFHRGIPCYRLDGDNLRSGLNGDLGFSLEDRRENIRRVAQVARLFNDAGISAICSLISPLEVDRKMARSIVGAANFFEIHLSTPLAVCEQRDPHGLYMRARKGLIRQFTGIDSPYETPENPEISIDTSVISLAGCGQIILARSQGYHFNQGEGMSVT